MTIKMFTFPSPATGLWGNLTMDVSSIILSNLEDLENICMVNKPCYLALRSVQLEEYKRKIQAKTIKKHMLRNLIEAIMFPRCFELPVFRIFENISWYDSDFWSTPTRTNLYEQLFEEESEEEDGTTWLVTQYC